MTEPEKTGVFIATTQGPVGILNYEDRHADPLTKVEVLVRGNQRVGLGGRINDFIQTLCVDLLGGSFAGRLSLSGDIMFGDSYQLGMFVALGIARQGECHLAGVDHTEIDQSLHRVIWATGKIEQGTNSNEYRVRGISHARTKITKSKDVFVACARRGIKVVVILPKENKGDPDSEEGGAEPFDTGWFRKKLEEFGLTDEEQSLFSDPAFVADARELDRWVSLNYRGEANRNEKEAGLGDAIGDTAGDGKPEGRRNRINVFGKHVIYILTAIFVAIIGTIIASYVLNIFDPLPELEVAGTDYYASYMDLCPSQIDIDSDLKTGRWWPSLNVGIANLWSLCNIRIEFPRPKIEINSMYDAYLVWNNTEKIEETRLEKFHSTNDVYIVDIATRCTIRDFCSVNGTYKFYLVHGKKRVGETARFLEVKISKKDLDSDDVYDIAESHNVQILTFQRKFIVSPGEKQKN
ncbi:MAG: hypothetical protein GKS00_24690 [Alphaproteobacteria bacterium]|nr:hypothetical protein [Alphaproteobacteria bacterium]